MNTGPSIRRGWHHAAGAWQRLRDSYFLRRLLLCALAVALPLLGLHAYTLYRQAEDTKADAVAAVLARSEKAAQDLDAVFSRAERVLKFLSTRQELQELDGSGCSELIKGLTSIDPMLANVGAVDMQGAPLRLSIVSPARFKSYKDVGWFKEALVQPGTFLSKPFYGDISQRPLVNLVMPVNNARGERIGFLGAAIDLTRSPTPSFRATACRRAAWSRCSTKRAFSTHATRGCVSGWASRCRPRRAKASCASTRDSSSA